MRREHTCVRRKMRVLVGCNGASKECVSRKGQPSYFPGKQLQFLRRVGASITDLGWAVVAPWQQEPVRRASRVAASGRHEPLRRASRVTALGGRRHSFGRQETMCRAARASAWRGGSRRVRTVGSGSMTRCTWWQEPAPGRQEGPGQSWS